MAEQQRQQPTDYWTNQVNQAIMHQDIAAERNRKDAGFLFDVLNYAASADYARKLKAEGDKAPKGTPKTDDSLKKEGDKKIEEGTGTGATGTEKGLMRQFSDELAAHADLGRFVPGSVNTGWDDKLGLMGQALTSLFGIKAGEKLFHASNPGEKLRHAFQGPAANVIGSKLVGAALSTLSGLSFLDTFGQGLAMGMSSADKKIMDMEAGQYYADRVNQYLAKNRSMPSEDTLSQYQQDAVQEVIKNWQGSQMIEGSGIFGTNFLSGVNKYLGEVATGGTYASPASMVARRYLKEYGAAGGRDRAMNQAMTALSNLNRMRNEGTGSPEFLSQERKRYGENMAIVNKIDRIQRRRSGDFSFGSDPLAKIGYWAGQGASRSVGNMGKTYSRFTNALNYLKGRR